MPPPTPLAALLHGPIAPGTVAWIGLRPARRAPMNPVECAEALSGQGLDGDRYAARSGGAGTRQVTLIAAEHLLAAGVFLARGAIPVALPRRNIVTRGINLLALKNRRFRLGAAVLETTGECHPCSRMEEALGPGGYNALRGHGGITARVLESGAVWIGDPILVLPPDDVNSAPS